MDRRKRIREFLDEPEQFHSYKDTHWTVPVKSRSAEYERVQQRDPNDRASFDLFEKPVVREKTKRAAAKAKRLASMRSNRIAHERAERERRDRIRNGLD